MKNWFLYIVECADGSYYTGITTNLQRRLLEHNYSDSSGSKYTRSRRPVRLVYSEACDNRSDASKKEYAMKKKSRQQKRLIVEKYKGGSNDLQ